MIYCIHIWPLLFMTSITILGGLRSFFLWTRTSYFKFALRIFLFLPVKCALPAFIKNYYYYYLLDMLSLMRLTGCWTWAFLSRLKIS